MIDFYLVTGFLGAGKTTFLKNFLQHLAPKRMHIIINEYGKVGIDGEIVKNLGADVAEINNGSIFCSCRLEQFEYALESAVQNKPEVVLVEASGLADPTGIYKILNSGRFSKFNYCGCICLVDALNFEKVFWSARVCAKQLSVSNLVLLNKTDAATKESLQNTKNLILERYPFLNIHETSFGKFKPEWLSNMQQHPQTNEETSTSKDLTLQKHMITLKNVPSKTQLEHFVRLFIEETFRIKGFVVIDGSTFLLNATGGFVEISLWQGKPPQNPNMLVALAGKGMKLRKSLKNAAALYPQFVIEIE